MILDKTMKQPKEKNIFVIGSVIFWYWLAHGYRMANTMFSHDAVLEVVQDDSAWQIALGRFMQPVLLLLRGGLASPWLISALALVWYSLAVLLALDLLGIDKRSGVMAGAGILVCNPTVVSAQSAFLQWVDFYALALFLAALGVWLFVRPQGTARRRALCGIAGVVSLAASMGIYQSYICVSIVLFMIVLLGRACQKTAFDRYVKMVTGSCLVLLVSALCYFLAWRGALRMFGIWTADTYNGMAGLGDYSQSSFPAMAALAYRKFFEALWHPAVFVTMQFHGRSLSVLWLWLLRAVNLVTGVWILGRMAYRNLAERVRPWQWAAQGLILLLFPLGANFVCLMTKGMEHTLMIYAFVFFYLLSLALGETAQGSEKRSRIAWCLTVLPLVCVIWSNVVYANQVYLKKELQDKAMQSLMTRIVGEIEATEGYVPGSTPVAFSGYFEASPYIRELSGFEELTPYGMGKTTMTYMGTDYAFLKYELNVPIEETRIAGSDPQVKKMPVYPGEGSIAYVGETLVVKLSD